MKSKAFPNEKEAEILPRILFQAPSSRLRQSAFCPAFREHGHACQIIAVPFGLLFIHDVPPPFRSGRRYSSRGSSISDGWTDN